MERISHYVGGKSVPGESGRTGPVYDPATGQQTHEVDFASVEEVDAAVDAAREAFPAWRATSLSQRADILFRLHDLGDDHRRGLGGVPPAPHREGVFGGPG